MAIVNINGISQHFDDGTLILNAAMTLGIEIPTFCSHPRLEPVAVCRMCLVEVEGQSKLLPSCATTVTDGMVVNTESSAVVETRKTMLEILLANHPLDCPVCDKGGECRLQDQVYDHGAPQSRFDDDKRRFHTTDVPLNDVVVSNLNRCIQCQLCVRYCDEIVGAQALGAIGIGSDTIVTGFMDNLASCDQCGNCIEVCPVGALMSRPYRYKSRPWDLKEVDTTCPFCGTGCQLTVGARDRELMRVRSKSETGLNREALCVRGRFGIDFTTQSQHRIQQPMIRRDQALVAVSWEDALRFIQQYLESSPKNNSRENNRRIGGLISPNMTNETLYGFQKLMQQVFDSHDIDSNCRWPLAEAYPILRQLIDKFYSRRSLTDILAVDSCLIIGSNVTDENPVSEYLIREAHRTKQFDLTVLSTRPSRLDSIASAWQRYLPGDEPGLIAPLLHQIETRIETRSVTVLVGTDVLRSPCVTQTLQLLDALLTTLSAADKQVYFQFLLDRCNQLGAWDLGINSSCDFEQMLVQCEREQMSMLYVVGEDPLLSCPDGERVTRALQKLDLLVVQDAFMTDTALAADVVLPGFTFAESAGTYTNNEGRVQRVRPIYPPPAPTIMNVASADNSAEICSSQKSADTIYLSHSQLKAKRDTDIFNEIASIMGKDLRLNSLESVFGEIAKALPAYQSIDVSQLGDNGSFTKTPPHTLGEKPPPIRSYSEQEANDAGSDDSAKTFDLITGNCLFHSAYLTEYSPTLKAIADQPYVELNDQDASALGLQDQGRVTVSNPNHAVTLRVKCNKQFPKGVAFIPENFKHIRLNRFIQNNEYPCAVRIQAALPDNVQAQTAIAENSDGPLLGGLECDE